MACICKQTKNYNSKGRLASCDCLCARRPISDLDKEVIADCLKMGLPLDEIADLLTRDSEHIMKVLAGR